MPIPLAEEQVNVLLRLQRLLTEGQFTATYKYALLISIADLAVEEGDDSGDPLILSTRRIAEKFIEYYWRQAVPYTANVQDCGDVVLRQNTDRQAAIIRLVGEQQERCGISIASAKRDHTNWRRLVNAVGQVVRQMPLWKLQMVGRAELDFIYENHGKGNTITLRPGVAYCFRQFHGLITELVRGAWVRYIRQCNEVELGSAADLHEFLFGCERKSLAAVRAILMEFQEGRCFYCERALYEAAEVDHFIPWTTYPVDLGHNFVLAHGTCNAAKGCLLASEQHLLAWIEQNLASKARLQAEFDRAGIMHNAKTSLEVARWAYGKTERSGGLTWQEAKRLVPLSGGWIELLAGSRRADGT